jgi:hypothetical protein
MENDDYLENRLKEATAKDLRQLLEEFLKAFFLDDSHVAVHRRPAVSSHRGLDDLTFKGHMTV